MSVSTAQQQLRPGRLMQIIGLTGGIGSGKSTACKIIKTIDKDVVIVDADELSRIGTKRGHLPYYLLKYFVLPGDCFDPELNRQKVASLIFNKTEKSRALKKIVERCIHPWVIYRMCLCILWCWLSGQGRIVLDIPLLFEAHLQWICTQTVLIDTTDPQVQLERILKRNPEMMKEDAQNRIASQFSMDEKRKLADVVIVNDSNLSHLKKEIERVFVKPNIWYHRIMYLACPIFLIVMWSNLLFSKQT